MRSPLLSVPMLASCQAAMLPLALSLMGRALDWAWVVVTVSAGLAVTPAPGPAAGLSAAGALVEKYRPMPPAESAQATMTRITTGLRLEAFMVVSGLSFLRGALRGQARWRRHAPPCTVVSVSVRRSARRSRKGWC